MFRTGFLFLITIFLFSSCASEQIYNVWATSKEYNRVFDDIMIMGLVNNVNLRSSVENEMVYASKRENIASGNGMSLFPPELGKPFEDIEKAKERMRNKGYDGVLSVALVNIKEERYIRPDIGYAPFGYYDRFGNYYYNTYELVYRPGYFQVNSTYFLEVNFYELKEGYLVWTGRSKDFSYSEFDDYLEEFSRTLFKTLIKDNIIQVKE